MAIFIIVATLSTLVAGLCLPGLFFWMFGVPGTAGNFMDGWTMGLSVLILYPISYIAIYVPSFIVWVLRSNNKISQLAYTRWQQGTTVVAIALLFIATIRMLQAFHVMSGS